MNFSLYRMGLLVFAVVKLCKYHQQENMRVSMAKERKRLINEDLVTEVSFTLIDEKLKITGKTMYKRVSPTYLLRIISYVRKAEKI